MRILENCTTSEQKINVLKVLHTTLEYIKTNRYDLQQSVTSNDLVKEAILAADPDANITLNEELFNELQQKMSWLLIKSISDIKNSNERAKRLSNNAEFQTTEVLKNLALLLNEEMIISEEVYNKIHLYYNDKENNTSELVFNSTITKIGEDQSKLDETLPTGYLDDMNNCIGTTVKYKGRYSTIRAEKNMNRKEKQYNKKIRDFYMANKNEAYRKWHSEMDKLINAKNDTRRKKDNFIKSCNERVIELAGLSE